MRDPCDICGGSRSIRLAIRQPLSSVPAISKEITFDAVQSSRDYPCPECCKPETAEMSVVHALGAEYEHAMKAALCDVLAGSLLREGFVKFEFSENKNASQWEDDGKLTGTIGVVSRAQVQQMQDRVKRAAEPIISAVAEKAIHKINVWGSHFGHSTVTKEEAIRFIQEACNEAQKS